jgi:hypothetical protein
MSPIHDARESEPSTIRTHETADPLHELQRVCNQNVHESINGPLPSSSDEKVMTPDGVDGYEVQFGGSLDRGDPRNFGKARKWMIVIILSQTSASV